MLNYSVAELRFKFALYINIYVYENHALAKPWHGENLNYPYHKLKTVK